VTETSIGPEDIVFDCPHCGKSLAIDPRGAGLTITCPDCESSVTVPNPAITEKDEDEDPSSTRHDEERDMKLADLEDALAASEQKVEELTESLQEVYGRRNYLEQMRADNLKRVEMVGKELVIIQNALDRITEALQNVQSNHFGDSDTDK
jgi:uncharacterized Zn finger protein (UPF0148 family)